MSKERAYQPQSHTGERLRFGKEGEAAVMAWLRRQPGVERVRDVSEVPGLRSSGFDCTANMHDGRNLLVEAKADEHLGKSGNLVVEVARIRRDASRSDFGMLGWSLRSKADWLIWYAPSVHSVWRMDFSEYQAGIAKYLAAMAGKWSVAARLIPTDDQWVTVMMPIPESFFVIHKHRLDERASIA